MEKKLRITLLILALVLFITTVVSMVATIILLMEGGVINLSGVSMWPLLSNALLNSLQPLAIAALCLFAAHKISPLGGHK